jgi:hypothetical protein
MSTDHRNLNFASTGVEALLSNQNFSMLLKSWIVFKQQCLDKEDVRNFMSINNFLPWREEIVMDEWNFKNSYSHPEYDRHLCVEMKKQQWWSYLDFWFQLCLENQYFYIKNVNLTVGKIDVGIFCKKPCFLSKMKQKLYGFLEQIRNESEFNRLQGYPSLYESNFVNENNSRFSNERKRFILFGPLACCNSNRITNIKFCHRNRCGFEDDLYWEVKFAKEMQLTNVDEEYYSSDVNEDSDVAYEVQYVLDIAEAREHRPNDDHDPDDVVGSICYNQFIHPLTSVLLFQKEEVFQRVIFGNWNGDELLDYQYNTNEEITINYPY